ncbi:hypothetical protein WGM54_14130 [Paenibacillus polymyxa]|uniref:hypothetical protein n=1 Tax=Paenibacillus polymyxa TaxID=1406 RepID=UPI00307E4900
MIQIGNKYELLTVKGKKGDGRWECVCDCGNPTFATSTQLKYKTKKSCGCLRKKSPANVIDITNNKYGMLTVIERAGRTKRDNAIWLCRCDCGKEVAINGTILRRGQAVSCGCQRPEQARKAREILQTEKTVDGVPLPFLTKKVRSDSKTGHKGIYKRDRKGREVYEINITIKGNRMYASATTLGEAIEKRKLLEEKYHKPLLDKQNQSPPTNQV